VWLWLQQQVPVLTLVLRRPSVAAALPEQLPKPTQMHGERPLLSRP
jgi:hypothetical protein